MEKKGDRERLPSHESNPQQQGYDEDSAWFHFGLAFERNISQKCFLLNFAKYHDDIDIPASYVVLDRRRMDVSTDAQALVEMAKYVLEAYPEAEADLLYRCSSWLASLDSDSSKTNGVFWSNGKRFYVDANANWEDKRRRMSELCAIAGVSPGTIYWHKSGGNAFTFSW